MSDLKQARVLLTAAERDISALRGMADAAVFADEIFGFHAQQAAGRYPCLRKWPIRPTRASSSFSRKRSRRRSPSAARIGERWLILAALRFFGKEKEHELHRE